MKTPKRISLLFLVWLLIACMIVPAWADDPTPEGSTATEPTLYFHIDFEDMAVGAVTSNTQIGTGNVLWLGVNQNISEENGNKVLRTDKAAGSGSGANPDLCLYPFRAMGVANLSAYKSDFVISWDLFVSDDDGADFNLTAGRSPDSSRKWGPSTFIQAADAEGKGHIVYWDVNGTKKTSDGTVAYGQWNNIAIVVHPAEGASEVTTFDIYVNSALIAEGAKIWFDTDRFTIGKLCNAGTTPADCYQMIDNIKCYSGSELWVASEPEEPEGTTAYTVGEDYISFTPTNDADAVAVDPANAWAQTDIQGAMGGNALYCGTKAANAAGDGFTWTFAVPATGDYTVWGRFYYPNQTANSLFYSVDGGAEGIWDLPDEDAADSPCYSSWHYFYMTERKTGIYTDPGKYGEFTITKNQWRHSPVVLHLTAGTHTVKFTGREAGMYIDELVITSYSVEEYDPNAFEGNTKIMDACKFCGTEWKHFYSDVYAETGVTARRYFTTVLHTDAADWENLGCESGIHNPADEIIVVTPATCTEAGVGKRVCLDCGETVEDNIIIEKLAHTPSDWIVDTPADIGVEGHRHKECTVCHTVLNEETIPAETEEATDTQASPVSDESGTQETTGAGEEEKPGCASSISAVGMIGYLAVLGLGITACRRKRS